MRQIRTRKVAAAAVLTCCGLAACTSTTGTDKGGSAGAPLGVAGSARTQASRSAEPSTRAGRDWNQLCVVAPLAVPDKWIKKVPATQYWSDGTAAAYVSGTGGELAVEEGGRVYQIFDGRAETQGADSSAAEVRGGVIGNKRWVVFSTRVPSAPDGAAVLRVWDRQDPQTAAGVLSREIDELNAQLQLRGDHLVWVEANGDQTQVRLANLDTQSVSTLTQGKISSVTLADEKTVVWRSNGEEGIATEIFDIETGKTSVAENPIAKMATSDGELFIDGGYWVLANVKTSLAGDDNSAAYEIWAWHPGWLDKKKVAMLSSPAEFSLEQPLRAGYLGLYELSGRGATEALFLINLATGYAQALQGDWSEALLSETAITVYKGSGADSDEPMSLAAIPYSEVALPGKCVGSPD